MSNTNSITNELAAKAWEFGYGYAVIGCSEVCNPYSRTNRLMAGEWMDGWRQAVIDGKWGTHPEYNRRNS